MSAVSGWLLSIACVVILSVLCEFILPEGQINKYIKVVFSFILLLVIIMPLPKFFGKDFDLGKYLGGTNMEIQEEYLEQVNLDKLNVINQKLSDDFQSNDIVGVKFYINADITTDSLQIYGLTIDLRGTEYVGNEQMKQKMTNIAKSNSSLNNVEVCFYE